MKRTVIIAGSVFVGLLLGAVAIHIWTHEHRFSEMETEKWVPGQRAGKYVGSVSCRECHERFYQLWSPSHHGKAMQPVSAELFEEVLTPQPEPINLGGTRWQVRWETREMVELTDEGEKAYPMVHAMGGKNVFFFLTPLERGRLQVMPLSYDVQRKHWFDTTLAMVRHFTDNVEDEAIDWRDPLLTFNTSCYNCHVSQLDKNYDAETDTYHTTWREPGINCEACHGPGEEHVEICLAVPKGTAPQSLRMIIWSEFTNQQINDSCMPCHAKARRITNGFGPGERFFDHYDLTTLEDRDFYPDGRDLGENYTQTGWLQNPCALSGTLTCIHCHTSSGRYRFKEENPNGACMPCHGDKVLDLPAHSRHAAEAGLPRCIDCHMPMTEFGRMRRSDHSMRPPSPAAGARFDSPVACVLCHKDEEPEWAAGQVEAWHPNSTWQARILHEGELVQAARTGKWEQLPAILDALNGGRLDPVVTTTLVRLLSGCPDNAKWPVLQKSMEHASPLVRGATAVALADNIGSQGTRSVLLDALDDEYRIVRIQAATALSRFPIGRMPAQYREAFDAADAELRTSFDVQPDAWGGYYNRGNYHNDRGEAEAALSSYLQAIELRSDVVMPYVNASMVASRLGRLGESVDLLKRASEVEPDHGAVNFNLGLALAEQGTLAESERYLELAMKEESVRAQAAYNLAVLVSKRDKARAIELCRTAAETESSSPRYAYTQAFFLREAGRAEESITVLQSIIKSHPSHSESWSLLGTAYEEGGQQAEAARHYAAMRDNAALPMPARQHARRRLAVLPKTM
ncbi:MAG: ammonia-forming cytochrome c nitrite reductase subunit c552 [Kiritimatiellae bacterium]|nr:ammonia-forming cytochrome c nitrite reductase subunit c552 [Kiritimatiellia bacterium]